MVQQLSKLLDSTVSTAQDSVTSALNLAKSASSNVLSTTSDLVSSVAEGAKASTRNVLNMVMKNKRVASVVVGVALVVYCSKVSFKLPNFTLKVMNNSNARMVALFGVAYLATKDVALALLTTVALMLTFNRVAIYRNNKKIAKALKGSDLKKLDDSDSDEETKSPEGSKNDIEAAPVEDKETETPTKETTETPTKETTETANSEVSGYGGDNYASL